MKIIRTLILVFLLLLCCGVFDEYTEAQAEEIVETEDIPVEEAAAEEPVSEVTQEAEQPEAVPTAEETAAEPTAEPVEESLPQSEWQGINSDQADALRVLYDQMTYTGQQLSGWFAEGNRSPCDWPGITCEEGQVTKLEFRDTLYFAAFPSGLDGFQSLKELHLVDTLMQGPLPETLWEDLPSLEVLELSGNLLTGEIPALPEQFAAYPVVRKIIIKDNKADERKQALPAYAEASSVSPAPQDYPDVDLTPGLDGSLPEDWARLPLLSEIDLSGNTLSGAVPDAWMALPLTAWNLGDNAALLSLSQAFYDQIIASGNAEMKLDGLEIPVPEPEIHEDVPTEPVIPTDIPTEAPVAPPVQPEAPQPTEVPVTVPTSVPEQPVAPPVEPAAPQPTEAPAMIPTSVPEQPVVPSVEPAAPQPTEAPAVVIPTSVPEQPVVPSAQPPMPQPTEVPAVIPTSVPEQPIYIVVTATSQPQWYTATPVPYQPNPQQPNPGGGYQQQPNNPQPQPYQQPTLMIYPLFTTVPPTEIPTASPTEDPSLQRQRIAASFGFTYVLESMTANSLPMTWRNNGMDSYSISYLDANGNLYPAYAMTWTAAAELCHSDTCTFTVTGVPEELLRGGTFSLRLEAKDANGQLYQTDPVSLAVSVPVQEPAEPPELHVFSTLLHWLFSPILNLFR